MQRKVLSILYILTGLSMYASHGKLNNNFQAAGHIELIQQQISEIARLIERTSQGIYAQDVNQLATIAQRFNQVLVEHDLEPIAILEDSGDRVENIGLVITMLADMNAKAEMLKRVLGGIQLDLNQQEILASIPNSLQGLYNFLSLA